MERGGGGSGVLVVLKQKMQNLKDDLEKYKDMYEDKCNEVARERSRRNQVFIKLCLYAGFAQMIGLDFS